MNIDIHAHFIPESTVGVVDDAGREWNTLKMAQQGQSDKFIVQRLCDPEQRIRDMDAAGVDMQVIAPIPALYYELDAESCLWYSRRQNDGIAETVREYPNRFLGMATVPLQAPDMAIAELDRAINKLGLRGIEILSNINGRYLDSPELTPFFKEVASLDVPVFIHPAGPVAGDDKMKKYHIKNLVGNPLDTTLTAAYIVFGGVLEKFPDLKFCLAHAGGFVPYQRGRWERGYQMRAESKAVIKRPPSHYVSLLYYDTITHFAPALEYLISSSGADKVLLGTDYPFDMGDPNPVLTVTSLPHVSEEDKQKILGGNAMRLFKL